VREVVSSVVRVLLLATIIPSLSYAQGDYFYDTTSNSTSTSTNTNNNTNNNTSVNTNTNYNVQSGTMTNINQNTNTSTNYNVQSGTVTNINQNSTVGEMVNTNTNINTNTSNSVNTNINTGDMLNRSINQNTSVSTVNSTDSSTINSTSNDNSVITQTVTASNQNNNFSESNANQTIDQTMRSPPPSAMSPSMMNYSQNVCTSGASMAVQTQILGFSGGKSITDTNCERLLLSRALFDMGMKVAAVSLLCADERVWSAMQMAGTPCPYEGKIGMEAAQAWQENPKAVPGYRR
jgi:hypothetical protein